MGRALRSPNPQGFSRRASLNRAVMQPKAADAAASGEVIEATYRQLLIRLPFGAERLGDAKSMLRDGRLSVADFVAVVASSDLFQNRLWRMAPLRAATAAHMALLGRAPLAAEVSRFLATRAKQGQAKAIEAFLNAPTTTPALAKIWCPICRAWAHALASPSLA
jgi:phycobilisome core-membrane linker protein